MRNWLSRAEVATRALQDIEEVRPLLESLADQGYIHLEERGATRIKQCKHNAESLGISVGREAQLRGRGKADFSPTEAVNYQSRSVITEGETEREQGARSHRSAILSHPDPRSASPVLTLAQKHQGRGWSQALSEAAHERDKAEEKIENRDHDRRVRIERRNELPLECWKVGHLVQHFVDSYYETGWRNGAVTNVRALSVNFRLLLEDDVEPAELRRMIDLFFGNDHHRWAKVPLWKLFLAERSDLLTRVRRDPSVNRVSGTRMSANTAAWLASRGVVLPA